ncbi:MAG: PKD domain-containing protein, partial [Bacteroidota bacterium]|nr:PKD domain-containing protein [Bacteroidota bacterium]
GLANVRVDMLQIRDSDDMVIAATHGRGIFSSMGFAQQVAPTANFGATDIFPCTGQTVTLSDSSLGSPTSYSWTITPGTFSYVNGTSSSSQNPQVQFNSVGVYTVSMTATNAQGTDTKTRTQFIKAGGASLPFTEDFEGSAEGWMVDNPDNATTWALYTIAGNSPGSQAVGVNNYSYNGSGQRDGLISPALNLSGYSTVTLNFEYAYRRYSSSYQDSMAVYVSTNCGSSWVRVASYRETGSGNFVTGSDITSNFVPSTSGDWCGTAPSCPSINLNAFAGNPNVRIKIENINGYGNNLYVDNVNITGTIGSAPTANFSANATNSCVGDTIDLNDLSTNNPTGWSWSFNPNTVTYRNGTNSSSQNPKVSFNSAGTYQVSLTATNSNGSDTEIKSGYITVSANLTPTVSITASANNICSGTNVSFTATPVHGGSSPTYQWRRNGVPVGSNSPTFSSNALSNNDQITVEMTSSESCVTTSTATSNSISMAVTPTVIPSISIQASATTICSGSMVTFTATPSNGGSTPSFQWKVNGSNAGSNSPIFSTNTLSNNDVVTVILTSNATCASPVTATSQGITISVGSPVTPGVSILASSNSICAGQSVTFTATPSNGGSNPSYQWKVNGGNVGTNSASYSSSSLSNGDVVSVVMTSSESCVTSSTAGSNSISMNVSAPLTPGVTIGASSTNICVGQTVNFTASPVNGGSNPIYQWKVNGVNVGTNSPGYSSSNLANGDQVSVEMTSSLGCVTSANAISNLLSITVQNPPVVAISSSIPTVVCKQDTLTLTGTPAGGTFYGSGGISGSLFIPILAGSGNHWVYYQYSTSNGCVGRDSVLVNVEIVPKPTITANGTQLTCNESGYAYQWMDANGPISGATAQTFTAGTNGSYRVEITGASCSDISEPVTLNNVHLSEWTAVSGAGLFPNPSNGHTTLEIQALRNEAASLELFDASGRIVWRSEILITPGRNQYSIELGGSLAKGVYSLQVAGESGHFVLRLEIQ